MIDVGDNIQLEEHLHDNLEASEAEDEGDQESVEVGERKADYHDDHRNDVCDGHLCESRVTNKIKLSLGPLLDQLKTMPLGIEKDYLRHN